MDLTDNVALMHTDGAIVDYDTIVVKPAYRPKNYALGATSRSELQALRKKKAGVDLSYDLDGDAQVSQRDYFFAQRFDVDGDGVLTEEERGLAAAAMNSGFGKRFAFLRGGGGQDAHHRVLQKDGVVLSEEGEGGGWKALAEARLTGAKNVVGSDGQLKEREGAQEDGPGGSPVHKVELTEEGRIAYDTVKGAVMDFDNVVTKPAYRPELHQSGVRTRAELLRMRRADARPSATYDLDGDGTVSQADYWFASRYDWDGSGHLDAEETSKAKADYDAGFAKKFVTISSSAGANQASRTVVVNGKVISDGEGQLTGSPTKYDPTIALPTMGAVPGLDLPADRLMRPKGFTRSGTLAGSFLARPGLKKATGPIATTSMGAVPGVHRAILRHPDGRQEAYGGYAGGMGAGPVNNVTGTMEAVMGATREQVRAAGERAMPTPDKEGIIPKAPISPRDPNFITYHNETSFQDRGNAMEVANKAPWAQQGAGGAAQAVQQDETGTLAATRSKAAEMSLITRTQLLAALRAEAARDLSAADSAFYQPGGLADHSGLDEFSGNAAVTLRAQSTVRPGAGVLPEYMNAAVRVQTQTLPTIRDDLPFELVKPGSTNEGERTVDVDTRSALLNARTRDKKIAALVQYGLPADTVALPVLHEPEFNDHHSHGRSLISDGQEALSKTKSELSKRRFADRVEHHLQYLPGGQLGIHDHVLHKFGGTSGIEDVMLWTHAKHGAEFDAKADELGQPHQGSDVFLQVDPAYSPVRRHTVRDTRLNGTAHLASTMYADTASAGGEPVPRLIRDGLPRESEALLPSSGPRADPFKVRTIGCRDTEAYQKSMVRLTEDPGTVDPWHVAPPADGSASYPLPSPMRTVFNTSAVGPARPLHTLHPNNSSVRNGLPGPEYSAVELRGQATSALPVGGRWAAAICDYTRRMDPSGVIVRLDEEGKCAVSKADLAPLTSSFTASGTYHEPYVGGGYGTAGRPNTAKARTAALAQDSVPRRESLRYGEALSSWGTGSTSRAGGSAGAVVPRPRSVGASKVDLQTGGVRLPVPQATFAVTSAPPMPVSPPRRKAAGAAVPLAASLVAATGGGSKWAQFGLNAEADGGVRGVRTGTAR